MSLKKRTTLLVLSWILLITACRRDEIPVADKWIELKAKQDAELEKTFRTIGEGVGPVSWWAGGYLWEGGRFEIELIDVRRKKVILKKAYLYGDTTTGTSELPLFKWWHAEEKDRILLEAGRIYRMKLKTRNLAQPGAGWGMWLYPIGEPPRRHEIPAR